MKTRYFILGAALCSVTGLGLTSCNNEEFLDVTAYDVVDVAASYESKENAKRALNGVYDLMFPDDGYDGSQLRGGKTEHDLFVRFIGSIPVELQNVMADRTV